MSLLADALQPLFARGLLSVRGPLDSSFDDLLGRRTGFIPSFDPTTHSWSFDFGGADELATALAADCSRFACAAFQSFAGVPTELLSSDTLPWGMIKAYYAAFYAGHSLLRLFGSTCSQFDGQRLVILRRVLPLYGVTEIPVGGLYGGAVVSTQPSVLTVKHLGGGRGTHELFWGEFGGALSQMTSGVISTGTLPRRTAQDAFIKLEALRVLLCRGSLQFNWLSSVRNDVQYRHVRGSWFPSVATHRERSALSRLAQGWTGDPYNLTLDAPPSGEAGLFIAAATFLVSLCRLLLERMSERSTSRQSFVRYGPLAYFARRGAH